MVLFNCMCEYTWKNVFQKMSNLAHHSTKFLNKLEIDYKCNKINGIEQTNSLDLTKKALIEILGNINTTVEIFDDIYAKFHEVMFTLDHKVKELFYQILMVQVNVTDFKNFLLRENCLFKKLQSQIFFLN